MEAHELTGSISEAQKLFVETWENVAEGVTYVVHEDRRGDEQPQAIEGQGRKFKISSYERMLTQDKIVDKKNDPFTNGAFRPVVVPQDISIETNPNALSEDDIKKLFKSSDTAWSEYMGVIDSPATLKRMIDLAELSEILSLKRYRELEVRYESFSNIGKRVTQRSQDQYDKMGPVGAPTGGGAPTGSIARPSLNPSSTPSTNRRGAPAVGS